MNKNILLVFTGGTIGSQVTGSIVDTSAAAGFKLLALFADHYPEAGSITFKSQQPLRILSENLHTQHWPQIIAAIEAEDLNQFDGIIVTHGTDTLAFSAAALGLYFHKLPIPLLLVSSDLPLDSPQANGLANFCCAVEFIRRGGQPGVYVPYRNPGQDQQVHLATRLSSCLPLSSDFISIQSQPFMRFSDGRFETLAQPDSSSRQSANLKPDFSARILLVRPYPGLDYTAFNPEGFDVVLHDLYHSGTACASNSAGDRFSLVAFIRKCREKDRKVYLAPALRSESAYASTSDLIAAGAEMVWNMSLEAAYAKLLLALGNFTESEQVSEFLRLDLAYEHVQPA
ncbi:asparaginase [Methylomonas sp. HW2-6]|uniref:asparaginase n=1 Tax=Methylomonas sp. HW2-6 TaxID=3376687 RepID=UPI004042AF9D